MKRRTFLTGLAGGAGAASTAGCLAKIQSATVGSPSCSMDGKEFSFGSAGFKSVTWVNLNDLQVAFKEDHNLDGFGIGHEYDDKSKELLFVKPAPKYGGSMTFPLIDKIGRGSTVYPSRTFKLVGYKGQFLSNVWRVKEKVGSVTFCIPKEIAPSSKFKDLKTGE
jgi:hypothetical protein